MNTKVCLPNTKKIAFIQANWHQDIVKQSRIAFTDPMTASAAINAADIDVFDVPGSLEIPLLCQRLAKTNNYEVIVAAGLIVDGGIYRHEFVAATVLDAMMQVQLETDVPILSVVLTPQEFDESEERIKYFTKHFNVKGREAANACIQVLENSRMVA